MEKDSPCISKDKSEKCKLEYDEQKPEEAMPDRENKNNQAITVGRDYLYLKRVEHWININMSSTYNNRFAPELGVLIEYGDALSVKRFAFDNKQDEALRIQAFIFLFSIEPDLLDKKKLVSEVVKLVACREWGIK